MYLLTVDSDDSLKTTVLFCQLVNLIDGSCELTLQFIIFIFEIVIDLLQVLDLPFKFSGSLL